MPIDNQNDDKKRQLVARKIDADIVPDGGSVTVPMHMMRDAQPRAVTLHRPGFVQLTDQDAQKRAEMYERQDAALERRWRDAPPLPADIAPAARPLQSLPRTTDREAMYDAADKRLSNRWRGVV